MMGRADHLLLGDWNVLCFQCGFKRKASMMEKNWQGYYVCPEHNEPRQPQDFVRAVPDNQNVPWSQPVPSVVYTYDSTPIGIGDGVTSQFQFGSGLGPGAVTYSLSGIVVGNTITLGGTINSYGVVTLPAPPDPGEIVYAFGTETVVA